MLRIVENPPGLIGWFRVEISAGRSSVGNADYAHHPPVQYAPECGNGTSSHLACRQRRRFRLFRAGPFLLCPRLAKYPSWYYRY